MIEKFKVFDKMSTEKLILFFFSAISFFFLFTFVYMIYFNLVVSPIMGFHQISFVEMLKFEALGIPFLIFMNGLSL